MVCIEVLEEVMNGGEGELRCIISHAIQPAGDVRSGGHGARALESLRKRFGLPQQRVTMSLLQGRSSNCVALTQLIQRAQVSA